MSRIFVPTSSNDPVISFDLAFEVRIMPNGLDVYSAGSIGQVGQEVHVSEDDAERFFDEWQDPHAGLIRAYCEAQGFKREVWIHRFTDGGYAIVEDDEGNFGCCMVQCLARVMAS